MGKEQLQCLEQGLLKSNATWKVVSDDDPIFIPECQNDGIHAPFGCDNWATDGNTSMNFVNERNDFLKFLDNHNIKNVIFVTTDVHFPANIMLDQDFNNDGHKLTLYELVSGPLTAAPSNEGEHLDIELLMPIICITKVTYLILDITKFRRIQKMEKLILFLRFEELMD